jgi:outer membrane protein OmpA-like peptidoglycan-associated protein
MLESILNSKLNAVSSRNNACNKICNETDKYLVNFVEGKSSQWRKSPNRATKVGGYVSAGAAIGTYLAAESILRTAEFATRGLGELVSAGWKKLPFGVREKPEELAGKVGNKYNALSPRGKRGVWACGALAGLALLFSGGEEYKVADLIDDSKVTERIAKKRTGRGIHGPDLSKWDNAIGGISGRQPTHRVTNMCEVQPNYSTSVNEPVLTQVMETVNITSAPQGTNKLGFKKHLDNKLEGKTLEIYFPFDESTISENDLKDIAAYLQGFQGKLEEFTVEGYACSMGGENINLGLSEKRANAVTRILQGKTRVPVHEAAYGEKKANGSDDQEVIQYDRKVRIVPNATPIQAGLDLLPSDHYLVDQSSSMGGNIGNGTKWSAVQKYKFPRDSSVYTFTSSPRTCGDDLAHSHPMGGTPLYQALHELVGHAEKGESITVLSDGMHTGSTSISPYQIIQAAKAKDLQINVLGLGLDGQAEKVMKNIANGTGGAVYMAGRRY